MGSSAPADLVQLHLSVVPNHLPGEARLGTAGEESHSHHLLKTGNALNVEARYFSHGFLCACTLQECMIVRFRCEPSVAGRTRRRRSRRPGRQRPRGVGAWLGH